MPRKLNETSEMKGERKMGNTITEYNLGIRPFQEGDESIVQKWRDEFPIEDGTEGISVELGDVYSDDTHFLLYINDTNVAIGSVYLREIEAEKSTEVILAIGDYNYMNREVFSAIFKRTMRFLKETYPCKQGLFLLDIKSVHYLMKGDN